MAGTKNVKRDSKGAQRLIMGAAGLFLGCLFLFPIYILVLNSFKNTKGIFTDVIGFPNAATFTLVNYPNAFEALEYIRSFVNSLTITVIATVLILLISSMAAWVLVRYKTKTSKIIFFLFAASMLIPFQCVMLPLVGFASRIGIMNPQGLIFMYMGFGSSMSIVMFHSFIKNIPEELPYSQDQKSHKSGDRVGKPSVKCLPSGRLGDGSEDGDEDELPGEAQQQAADQVRHEEDAAKQRRTAELLCHQKCQGESDDIDQHHRTDGKQRSKAKRVHEGTVSRKYLNEISKTYECNFTSHDSVPVCKGVKEANQHRNQNNQGKRNQCRGQKYPESCFALFHFTPSSFRESYF